MTYPYITLLEISTILLTLFIGIEIFCLIVKKWQRAKFLTAFKAIVLYELASLLLYFIHPLFVYLINPWALLYFSSIEALIYGIISFFVFYFIMKKVILMNWKKSLITFLLTIIIIFPFLDYLRVEFITIPIFTRVNKQVGTLMKVYHGFGEFIYAPPAASLSKPNIFFQIGEVENATLSWPSDFIKGIIFSIPHS